MGGVHKTQCIILNQIIIIIELLLICTEIIWKDYTGPLSHHWIILHMENHRSWINSIRVEQPGYWVEAHGTRTGLMTNS